MRGVDDEPSAEGTPYTMVHRFRMRQAIGQRHLRRGAARGTPPAMAAIFGNVRLDGRHVRHLMASWVADVIARVQGALAMPTRVRDKINDCVHTFGGNQRARMARMAWLTAWFATALPATTSFARAPREAVRGWRLRGRRRVLLPQRELALQIGDALGLLGNLALAFGKLPSQALNLLLEALLAVVALLSLGPRHASHSTPIGSTCTAP
jgi:hypothetical protein